MKESYHNSRTSNSIEMKLGAVTQHDKRNNKVSKNDDEVISANFDAILTPSGSRIQDS